MKLIKAVFEKKYSVELFETEEGDFLIRENQDLISSPTQDFLLASFIFDLAKEKLEGQ